MPGFGVSFNSAAHALESIQRALTAVQNNIVNANTPGYASERVVFYSQSFDVANGLVGGVEVSLASTRDQYLERSVRAETSSLGFLDQSTSLLTDLQSAFSASGDEGVPDALSSLASSFSALSAAPNDATAKANILQAADSVAKAFNDAASRIARLSADVSSEASSTVTEINNLSAHVSSLNAAIEGGAREDAGIAADLNQSLESLSELVNISVSYEDDGSASVLMDGQTPLVLRSRAFELAVHSQAADPNSLFPGGDAGMVLLDGNGNDVTEQAAQGRLGALLRVRNESIRYYLGSQTAQGALNDLAKTFASRVNTIITNGQTANGRLPSPLFDYDLTNDTRTAATLKVGTLSADQIASGDSSSVNGVADELSQILDPVNSSDLMSNGQTFTAFYGALAGHAGVEASDAATNLQTQQSLTTQAQNQRTQTSGVSLNEQAAQLLSLQQSYQATARIISILNNLSQTAVEILPQN